MTVIEWATGQWSQRSPDAPVEDHGPGVFLGSYRRSDLPPEVIQRIRGFEFAIKIPREVYESCAERLIEVDESVFGKLVLR